MLSVTKFVPPRAGARSNCSTCNPAAPPRGAIVQNDGNSEGESPSRRRSRSPARTTDPIRSD